MAVSLRTKVTVAVLIVGVLAVDFHFVFREPTPELVQFVSRVTANQLPPLPVAETQPVEAPPASSANRQFRARGADDATKPLAVLRTDNVKPDKADDAPKYNFRDRRFNAKLHMVNQAQLFVDYPISYWLTVDVGMADWPFINANLISIIHPIVALVAGYLIVKSATSGLANANANGTNGGNGVNGSPAACSISKMEASVSERPLGKSGVPSMMLSSTFPGENVPLITSTSPNINVPQSATPSASATRDLTLLAVSPTHHASRSMGTPGLASVSVVDFETIVESTLAENELVQKEAAGTKMFSSVNVRLLRLAAFVFWLRNFLDTLDGVIARVQRHRAGVSAKATTVGLNGHSLDMATDTLGVVAVGLSMIALLMTKNLVIARIPAAIMVRLGYRTHLSKNQIFSKAVAWAGLLYLMYTAAWWETFMLRYANLFDQHANTNPAIFVLDNNFHVRLSEFLWSYTCGDALLQYLILAMFFNKIWETVQCFCFVGIPWSTVLAAYSFWVWNRVILADPTAALIVAENPELFM
jgi:phosphatidylglycerophosphate synthase